MERLRKQITKAEKVKGRGKVIRFSGFFVNWL